jgi:hypothetical protein
LRGIGQIRQNRTQKPKARRSSPPSRKRQVNRRKTIKGRGRPKARTAKRKSSF